VELLISAHSNENGPLNSAKCSLDGAVTLGRGPDSPVMLDGTGISREHFRLHSEGNGIFITDLSSNGTWLNTQRLTRGEPSPLTPADAIKIPGFEIRIDLPDAAPDRKTQATVPSVPETPTALERTRGPLEPVRNLWASLSRVEKLLIALAVGAIVLAALYLQS
jgi:pSer/pThr/pTyr-binding forkhead associated (FHA) protein